MLAKITAFVKRWPEYRKAIGGFLGVAVPQVGALITWGVVGGDTAETVLKVLAVCAPLFAYFGVAISKPNAPKAAV